MRKPFPWYSDTRSGGGWFVQLGGEQLPLGKHPEGATTPKKKQGRWNPPAAILAEFYRQMSVYEPAAQSDYALETICALYLGEVEEADTALAERYRPILGQLCDHEYRGRPVGKLLVNADLDAVHLRSWAATLNTDSTRRTYINVCKACVDWAVERKAINVSHNPFRAVKAPGIQSRAVVISKEEHEGLLRLWEDQPMRDLLRAMWVTGARPGELAKVEARHYQGGVWKLDATEHKTGYVTGRDRVIGVVGELIEVVDRLCRQYPAGPLFRNTGGRPWNAQATYVRFETARRKKVIRQEVTPYAYRHAWATHALESGNLTEYEVAKALGHQTTQMVMLHYDHSRRNHGHLRGIFERAGR